MATLAGRYAPAEYHSRPAPGAPGNSAASIPASITDGAKFRPRAFTRPPVDAAPTAARGHHFDSVLTMKLVGKEPFMPRSKALSFLQLKQ